MPIAHVRATGAERDEHTAKTVKCVVWDLDGTLWHGTLIEDGAVQLREGAAAVIKTLDARGILQSIASKNDHVQAMAVLHQFGLAEYFLYPKICWSSKASSIDSIIRNLNIGADTVAFVDDQAVERDEVTFVLPEVRCLEPTDLHGLLARPDFMPRFITEDSSLRRHMYLTDMERQRMEDAFEGPKEDFLATLGMELTITRAGPQDLKRAEELTVRTNQLNSTGYTYSYAELDRYRTSPDHLLLIAGLVDRYGPSGKIGLSLIECGADTWTIKLLLMSCRVMTRGVGGILISYIMRMAKDAGVRLAAEFVPNGRNRMMAVAYAFANFKEAGRDGDVLLLANDLSSIQPFPNWVRVHIEDVKN